FVPAGAGPLAVDGAALDTLVDESLRARVLVAARDADDVDAVSVLARVLASGGSAVLVTGADPASAEVADVAATERTTATPRGRPHRGPGAPRATDSAEDLACHDHAADLVGALVDLGDLGVAHHALHWEVTRVPGAAEELHRVGGDLHRHVRGVRLGGGGHEAELLATGGGAPLGVGGGGVDHQPGGLHLHLHVGQHELRALEVRDRPAELLALLGVPDRRV